MKDHTSLALYIICHYNFIIWLKEYIYHLNFLQQLHMFACKAYLVHFTYQFFPIPNSSIFVLLSIVVTAVTLMYWMIFYEQVLIFGQYLEQTFCSCKER